MDFRFTNSKLVGIQTDKKGEKLISKSADLSCLLVEEACQNEAYVIEDFPEDASDIPGRFETEGKEEEEELAVIGEIVGEEGEQEIAGEEGEAA